MRQLLNLIFLFAAIIAGLQTHAQVRPPLEANTIRALNELDAQQTLKFQGDALVKSEMAYIEWDGDCFRFRRITTGAAWSDWLCIDDGEQTTIGVNAQSALEIISNAINFKVQNKHTVLQSDEGNNFVFKGNVILGENFTALGFGAGQTGFDSLVAGGDTILIPAFDNQFDNVILIGHGAQERASNTAVIGDSSLVRIWTAAALDASALEIKGDSVFLRHLVNLVEADSGKIAMHNGSGVVWIPQKADSIQINGEWVELGGAFSFSDSIQVNGVWVHLGGSFTTPDAQNLSWDSETGALGISGGTGVDLDGRYLIPPTATDGQMIVKSGVDWVAQTPDLSKWESDDYGYHSKGDIFTNHIGIGANSNRYYLLNVVNDNGFYRAINATSNRGIAICGTSWDTNIEVAAIQGYSPYAIAVSGHSAEDGIGIRGTSNQGYSGYFSGGEGVYVTEGLKVGTDGAKITRTGSMAEKDIWTGTQAQYDLIGTPDPNTVYFINNGWWALAFLLLFSFSGFGQKWDAVKIGSTDIVRIYQGADLIWEKESTPSFPEVTIGTQTWMAVNLDIDDGLGGIYAYDDNEANVATYGRLYTWDAAVRVAASIEGWHLPSDAEWTTLTTYLGGESVAGGKLKETGTAHWTSPNTGATNESGFTALPGGGRQGDGAFGVVGYSGTWWSATESDADVAWFRYVGYDYSDVFRTNEDKEVGFSVRLIKNTP